MLKQPTMFNKSKPLSQCKKNRFSLKSSQYSNINGKKNYKNRLVENTGKHIIVTENKDGFVKKYILSKKNPTSLYGILKSLKNKDPEDKTRELDFKRPKLLGLHSMLPNLFR